MDNKELSFDGGGYSNFEAEKFNNLSHFASFNEATEGVKTTLTEGLVDAQPGLGGNYADFPGRNIPVGGFFVEVR